MVKEGPGVVEGDGGEEPAGGEEKTAKRDDEKRLKREPGNKRHREGAWQADGVARTPYIGPRPANEIDAIPMALTSGPLPRPGHGPLIHMIS